MPLEKYNKKRNFSKTPEPRGRLSHQSKHLYVIQKHAASHLHYDLRLELNGVLLSWAVPKGPCLDPSVKRLAMHVEDHPVEYGHFQGIIPKGEYGGGTVMLWDEGIWLPEDDDPLKAYKKGHLHFSLKADKLNGSFNLFKLKKYADDKSWFLVKTNDKYARSLADYDITIEEPNSVQNGETIDEIADNYKKVWSARGLKKAPPKKSAKPNLKELVATKQPSLIHPQLATLVSSAPEGDAWLHELKFDGYRIIAYKTGAAIRLLSRTNKDWTEYFPNVVRELKKLAIKNAIFDGEVVLLDANQHSNFQLLQNSIKAQKKQPFIYYIFDLLYYDKFLLTELPLLQRKELLSNIITKTNAPVLRFSAHMVGSGRDILQEACAAGLEGIISKLKDGHYEQKRSKSWVKNKCTHRQEFVIGGHTLPKNSREHFGSLFLGVYNNEKELIFCGNVGTGFTQKSLADIADKLAALRTNQNPFNTKPPGSRTAQWVKPKLVAEVEFTGWTEEGSLRHPSFKGLRSDKPAIKIMRENAERVKNMETTKTPPKSTIKLTNPNKVLYPEDGITKLDLVNYYNEVSKWILPYISNRPLTIVRCPDSYQKCFYQKHTNASSPKSLHSILIKEKTKSENYIYINDNDGLLALVQMGVLEMHPWGSTIKKINYPDMMIFDLDPAPDVKWVKVVEAALLLRKHLKELHLKSYVKTTGGKGLHVVVPIVPEHTWDTIKNFSHHLVNTIIQLYPGHYLDEMSKNKRKGKIFIDYLRNARGATAIAAYSTRARTMAPVSTPLHWDELTNDIRDTTYTIFTLPDRLRALKSDPWKDFFKLKQTLKVSD